jgi:hypothetical protein
MVLRGMDSRYLLNLWVYYARNETDGLAKKVLKSGLIYA